MKKEIKIVLSPDCCSCEEFANFFLTGLALQKVAESCNYEINKFNKLIFNKVKNKELTNDFEIKKFITELTFLPYDLNETDIKILSFVRIIQLKWLTVPFKISFDDIVNLRKSKLN